MSQELAIGETFNRFVLDRDLFDIKDDGYLQLKDYRFNENGYSFDKIYTLCQHLPKFIGDISGNTFITFQAAEYGSYDYGTSTTTLYSMCFPEIRVTVNKVLLRYIDEDDPTLIDVVNCPNPQFQGTEPRVFGILQRKLGIDFTNPKWIDTAKNRVDLKMEIYVSTQYGEADDFLREKMVETLEQYIIFFYRSMMLLADKWQGSTLSSLNKESEKLFGAFTQKRFSSHPSRIFNESIKDFSELCSKTKFGKSNQKSSRALTLQKPAAIHRNPYSSSHHIRGVAFKRGQIYKKHDGFFSKSWSLRYAVLDNTALYYFKDDKESSGLKQTIDLKGGRLENYQDDERKPAFKVTDKAGNSYIFSGTNQFDNEEWKGLMEKATDIKQDKVEPLPGAAGQPARFIQKDSHLPMTKVNEAKSFLGEIAMSNLGLVSVVNGVRVFGPINNELQHELTLSRNRHFEFIQIELLFDFLRTKKSNPVYIGSGAAVLLLALIFYNFTWFIIQLGMTGYGLFKVARSVTKTGPKILSSSLVYKFYAKKVIDMRQDLLLQQLTDPRTFFAFKSYFRGVNLDEGVSNGFNLTYKCKMAISPHFLSTPQEIDLSCSIVDDTTILIEYSVKGEKLHMQEIIYLESSKSIPGKTIVYDYLIVKGKLVQCYRDAQKQAEFVFMNLQLLDEIVEGKLDLTNPNHIILSGKLPIGYNHRLDIEGMNDPRYNEVFDVKHYGFIKEKPVFESIGEPFDLNLIQRVRTGNTHGIMAQSFEKRVAGYNVGSTGGVFCTDISEIKSQEGIAVDMASRLGKTLFEGKELVTLSLPIRIFQPIGLLEHTTRYWGMMPYFLKLAALEKDKVERLKWCCSFAVSGFWNCCRQKKPFHPILGESLQAFWEDGSSIDVEYTSHIPPTCNFLVEDVDRLYRFHGRNEFKMKMNGTSMEGQNYGPNVIQFADGDRVDLYYPPGNISGLFMGDRSMCYTGSYIVRYPTADLEANINLVPMGSCQPDNPNEIRGRIYQKSAPDNTLAVFSGSWTKNFFINNQLFWCLEYMSPSKLVYPKNVLPSDTRFRDDIYQLYTSNMEKAGERKELLEARARRDRELRISALQTRKPN